MLLRRVLEGVPVTRELGTAPRSVKGLSCDSRRVKRGDLFFALPGARTDGRLFIQDALRRGAAAVVAEAGVGAGGRCVVTVRDALGAMARAAANFFGHPSRGLKVIGVTGTNGKTTTTYFLEGILNGAGLSTGVIGTVNYRLRGRVLSEAPNTTPLSLELQGLLARMKRAGARCAAMEVSSHALELGRVDEVEFDGAVFTNLYRDHLDFHKTRERYLRAKARLFEKLDAGSKPGRFAVFNADDPASARLARLVTRARVRTYGVERPADHAASEVSSTLSGTRFDWMAGRRRRTVRLKLIGRHNVYNALAAAAAAVEAGVTPEEAVRGLERLERVPGRLEPVKNDKGVYLFVDYAHTDSALELVLKQLHALPHRRIYTVFGCGGDRDRGKRGPMGRAAARWSDLAILTSDNPRTEDPMRILKDIERGIRAIHLRDYEVIPDRRKAIDRAVKLAQPGDTVLIAGKGHETYQIFKDRTIHFDDKEAAADALKAG